MHFFWKVKDNVAFDNAPPWGRKSRQMPDKCPGERLAGLELTESLGTLRYTTARYYYGYFGREGLG